MYNLKSSLFVCVEIELFIVDIHVHNRPTLTAVKAVSVEMICNTIYDSERTRE